jgi:membrane protein
VVPLLAFAFAVLKGFGAYQTFVDGTVRPYLRETFAANPALHDAIERTLRFVDDTDVSRLGTVAVLFLLYTAVTLVSSVEEALNVVFGAKTSRSLLRQLTDYTTLLVVAPILLVSATTLSAAAQSSRFVAFLRETLALGPVIDFVVGLAPLVAVGLAFFATYVILPNVRTRLSSALLGASVAALLWQGALVLHVRSQLGVAKYNALYSGVAALPIFLVWTYASWIVLLVGAQLAASHQGEQVVRQRFRMRHVDQALREVLAVAVGAVIARDFLDGGPRRSADALAELLEVPPPLVEEVLEALARTGLVARAVFERDIAWVPGRDVDAIRVGDLREAVRRDPEGDEIRDAVARELGPGLQRVLREVEAATVPERDLTLRQLAAMLGARGGAGPRRRGGAAAAKGEGERDGEGNGGDVADPKQPDLPA